MTLFTKGFSDNYNCFTENASQDKDKQMWKK